MSIAALTTTIAAWPTGMAWECSIRRYESTGQDHSHKDNGYVHEHNYLNYQGCHACDEVGNHHEQGDEASWTI